MIICQESVGKTLLYGCFTGKEAYPIYFGATPEILRLAGELRHSMTPSEKILWSFLRNRKLSGFKFRRQHPIAEFIVDFYCHESLLAIEVDGAVHDDLTQSDKDLARTVIINSFGINVIRFTNDEVDHDIERVINKIMIELQSNDIK